MQVGHRPGGGGRRHRRLRLGAGGVVQVEIEGRRFGDAGDGDPTTLFETPQGDPRVGFVFPQR